MKKIHLFIAAIVAFSQLLSAQIDYTITKDSVGNDHTFFRLEHQNGRYAEYMLEGNPDDISASFVDYINQDPQFNSTTDDQLVTTITLPAADLGFTPIEFCDVGDKLYCFGGNAVFQVDPATSNILNVIPLSNAGSYFMQTIVQLKPNNRFIIGDASQNRLFVADLSNNFYVINTLTDQVIATHTLAAFAEQQSTCIGYNSDDDIVYWMVNSWEDGTVIKSYNAVTGSSLQSASFTFQINDILFSNGAVFITTNEPGIKKLDKNTLLSLNSTGSAGSYLSIREIENGKIAIHSIHDAGWEYMGLYNTSDLTFNQSIVGFSHMEEYIYLEDFVYSNLYNSIIILYREPLESNYKYVIETSIPDAQGQYVVVDQSIIIYNKRLENLALKQSGNDVFISGNNYLNMYSLIDYSILPVSGTIESCTSKDLLVTEISSVDYIFSANPLEGTYSKHSTNVILQDMNQTAFKTNLACYNSQDDKLYFLNNRINYENSGVAIVDASDNSIEDVLRLGEYLTDIVYNVSTNRIFICSEEENTIYILDGTSNSLINTIYVGPHAGELFSYEDKIYCGRIGNVLIIDALSFAMSTTQVPLAQGVPCTQFEANPNRSFIYALFSDNTTYVAEINMSQNQLLGSYSLNMANSRSIKYNSIEEEVYVGETYQSKIHVYDQNGFALITEIDFSMNNQIRGMDLEFDYFKNKIYAFANKSANYGGNVVAISCVDHSVVSNKTSNSPEKALSYNSINDQVYYYNMAVNSSNRLEQFFAIDDCLDDITENEVYAGNILSKNYSITFGNEDIESVFVEDDNMLYMPNGAFSNVSVIQCHNDFLEVEAGWNWLSFPRMERYLDANFNSEAELSYLSIFPERYLKMHYEDPFILANYKQFDPSGIPSFWSGELNNLNSTKGYKLRIGGSDDPMYTHLKGGKLEPETFMDLYASAPENWVGYFVEYPQLPQDCFSPATWDALTSVVTRYWSIYKVEPSGGGTYWLGSGQITPFEYGDLIILTVDDDHAFSWVESDNHTEALELPETAYYDFEEQASYLPYYIEFDSISDAQEVAILADGDVVGATVRQVGDTLIEVNAYLEGVSPEAEIGVETWSGMKSSAADIEYSVFNQKTYRYENRTAVAGETARYQLISLKKSIVETAPEPLAADVSCYPNPFNDHVNFSIDMKTSAAVRLDIRDVNGRLIANVREGKLEEGQHMLLWEGKTINGYAIGSGLYYYTLVVDGQMCTNGKLIKH